MCGRLVAYVDRVSQVAGDGLLAERRDAGFDEREEQLRVGAGRGRDHDAVEVGSEQVDGGFNRADAQLRDERSSRRRRCVSHHKCVDRVEREKRPGVEGADPAETDESDAHGCAPGGRG